jgi:hypothetical protein
MGSDIKARTKEIEQLRKKIAADDFCDALQQHVYSPRESQEKTREASCE